MMRDAVLLIVPLLATAWAQAVDGVYAEAGAGNSIDIARVGMMWKWDRAWAYGERWRITGAWEAAVGALRGVKPGDNHQTVGDMGVMPMFRLARTDNPHAPYFEGGFLGLHLISKAFAYDGKKFGSSFQFGHFLGVGVDFGHHQYSLACRFQHMSNAGIAGPNQGVNLSELHLAISSDGGGRIARCPHRRLRPHAG